MASALLLLVATGAARGAAGQTGDEESPTRSWAVTATLDVASRYLFRGHEKDENGGVFQTALGATVRPFEGSGPIRRLSIGGLVWSSVHAGTRVHPGEVGFYELDLALGVDASLANGWTVGMLYTSYLAPADAFATVHEVALVLRPGSIGQVGGLAVSTRALLAHEIDDRGGPDDTYLELGADVALPPMGVVEWIVPLTVGLSVDGFYRDERGDNEWLGFVATGLQASVRLEDLGIGWRSTRFGAGFSLAFENPAAGLTRDPENDVLWTLRAGLGIEIP
jgi:hypothetical protein